MAKELILTFHGRVIDHLGYQMYQSPVAAIAEMVSNSWDADAEIVEIELPEELNDTCQLILRDNGNGMTFEECQNRFLNVGYDTRQGLPEAITKIKNREVLGRKGIGKFAGFGIAKVIIVDTTSRETGERTVFELHLSKLRGEKYKGDGEKKIEVLSYQEPNEESKIHHGTTIILKELEMSRRPSENVFGKSMARRFLLQQRVNDFKILVNGSPLPESEELENVEYIFPRDFFPNQMSNITISENGWGIESINDNQIIKWRIVTYKEPIEDEELRGVAVFAKGKLAQVPFLFNLTGGISGQQGYEYISGRVEADYIDNFGNDIIATERQRINWDRVESEPLLLWGQNRIKQILRTWVERRTQAKVELLKSKIQLFDERLNKMQKHERKIVEGMIGNLAKVSRISQDTFVQLGTATLTAWEGGRLRELIHTVSEMDELSESGFLEVLFEANVLTALHTAEAVKVKLDTIQGLENLIQKRELENNIRDYIAENPWLLSPKWETYRKEKSIENILLDAAKEVKIEGQEDWNKRVDLVLASGNQLLIVEFMRPGIKIDFDHINRFEYYITSIGLRVAANSGGQFQSVVGGYLVADKLVNTLTLNKKMKDLSAQGLYALDWDMLLKGASAQWKEFLEILAERAPEDDRIKTYLVTDIAPDNSIESI